VRDLLCSSWLQLPFMFDYLAARAAVKSFG